MPQTRKGWRWLLQLLEDDRSRAIDPEDRLDDVVWINLKEPAWLLSVYEL